ncbi:DUF6655 family protein [Planctomycetes bacterium K23_9]|uniref:Uncharacterized protein n=1 Tax=Stieleria marina TaxID=1930275 RepID=A0A517NTB7_9BACT|nr:hypothetical protein K239x_23180 [Planctomycetes bacterium K23_9]
MKINGLNRHIASNLLMLGLVSCVLTGCATTKTSNTARTGNEQILISSAIDRAMSNVRFNDFANYTVFVDDKFLASAVDKGYLVGEIRHKVLQGGGRLATKVEDADIVLEPRSGGVGTDSEEAYIGIPAIGFPGLPIELPEIKFAQRSTQMGTAKIGLVAYDAKTGASLGRGGTATALTHANDTYVLGVGPFRSGSVVDTREKAVGFDGVGGSLIGSGERYARRSPVLMIENKLPIPAPPTAAPPATNNTNVVNLQTQPLMRPASAVINK